MIPNGPVPQLMSPYGHPLQGAPAQPVDLDAALQKALAIAAYIHGQSPAAAQPRLTPLHMADDRLPSTLGGHTPVFQQPAPHQPGMAVITDYDPIQIRPRGPR